MAILFITHKFPPGIGGMEKQSYELINVVRKHTKVYTIIQSPTESKFIFFIKLKNRIKRMLSAHSDITAIHCNDGLMASACIWVKKKYTIPVTATFHGLDIVFPNIIFQNYIVPRLRRLDYVFAVSSATKAECLKRGFRKDQVVEICNGVDHELLKTNIDAEFEDKFLRKYDIDIRGKRILLSIGRSVKRKGFSWFAKEVMPHLPSDVYYLIVGPRSDKRSFLNRLIRILPSKVKSQIELFLGHPSDDEELDIVLNNSKNRSFHIGVLTNSDLRQLTSYAKLLVMPNVKVEGDMEGFGLVGLEANLCGTYVAGSNMEGITSAIAHNKNGVLIAPEMSKEWISVINSILGSSEDLERKEVQAAEYVRRTFSWSKMAHQYFVEFEKLSSRQELLLHNDEMMVA